MVWLEGKDAHSCDGEVLSPEGVRLESCKMRLNRVKRVILPATCVERMRRPN